MADPTAGGLVPPMDSSGYGDYLDVQRKQALASMLMQNSQRSLQTPQDWNSMKVVPRKSILSGLAGLGSAYAGGKAQQQANQAQLKYMSGMFGDTPQTPAQPPAAPAQAPGIPPDSIRAPGYMPSTPAPQQSASAGPSLQNSMVPPGMSKGMAARIWMTLGPKGYAEKVLVPSQMGTPEWQTLLRATRGNVDQAAQLLLMKNQKGTLTDVRPGGTLVDATGNPMFSAPQNGVQTTWQNGQPSASAVPGAIGAAAGMAGATDAAKTANTLGILPTAGGGSKVGYFGDVLGTPPGMRQDQPSSMGLPANAPPKVAPLTSELPPQAAQPAPAQPAGPKPYFQGSKAQTAPEGSPWANIPKLPSPDGLGVNPIIKGRIDNAIAHDKVYGPELDKQASLANQRLEYNSEALRHLPNAEVGPMSEWLTKHRSGLIEAGIPESLIPKSGTVTPTLELNKALTNAALQGARDNFPRLTENEVFLQKHEMSASASMTAAAIKSLVNQDNIKAKYTVQMNHDYNKYVNNGGDPRQFVSWYTDPKNGFPLTRFAAQQMTPTTVGKDGLSALQRVQKYPELAKDFEVRFGWKPYPGE